MIKNSIKILKLFVPSHQYIKDFYTYLCFVMIILTFTILFYFSGSNQIQAQTNYSEINRIDNTMDGAFAYITGTIGGQLFNCFYYNTPIGKTSGNDTDCSGDINTTNIEAINNGTYNGPVFWFADGGAIGRLNNFITASASYKTAEVGHTILYYATLAKNEVYANTDSIQSGRNVLTPIFFMHETTKNIALSIIVVLLILGGFNLLISGLTFAESKINVVQLIMNTGLTTIVILLYYEIAAIIYDLTVNYGNALVASALSPYINAKAILERLEPGGDLNIIALLSTMYHVGVTDSLLVALQSLSKNFEPILIQSGRALSGVLPNATTQASGIPFASNVLGALVGTISSFTVGGYTTVGRYILSAKPLFDTIVALVVFFLQIKIFFSLLMALVSFVISVGVGPFTIVSSGINDGWEKGILPKFQQLIVYGLVFPTTFFFILIAAIALNIRMYDNNQQIEARELICTFFNDDVENRYSAMYSDQYNWIKENNTLNQRIFDTIPAFDGSCHSLLFGTWFALPAPLGILGSPADQPLVITSLIWFFVGFGAIISASRAEELLRRFIRVEKDQDFSFVRQEIGGAVSSLGNIGALVLPTVGSATLHAIGFGAGTLEKTAKAGLGLVFRIPVVGPVTKFALTPVRWFFSRSQGGFGKRGIVNWLTEPVNAWLGPDPRRVNRYFRRQLDSNARRYGADMGMNVRDFSSLPPDAKQTVLNQTYQQLSAEFERLGRVKSWFDNLANAAGNLAGNFNQLAQATNGLIQVLQTIVNTR